MTDPSGAPIGNALVTVSDAAGQLLQAPTRPDGKLFFFPGVADAQTGDDLQIARRSARRRRPPPPPSVTTRSPSPSLASKRRRRRRSIALGAIDTTGTLGDELAYLQVEVSAIAAQVAHLYPNVAQRLALILDRDTGDVYVVRHFDFTDSLTTFQAEIAAQDAEGAATGRSRRTKGWPRSGSSPGAPTPSRGWRSGSARTLPTTTNGPARW